MKQITARLLAFGLVGGAGFVVDAGILQLLYSLADMSALAARAISFPVAVTVTWVLNKNLTFRDRGIARSGNRYALYFAGQVLGALINVAVFVVAIKLWPTIAQRPILPMAAGSAIAMFFNYLWSSLLVFAVRDAGMEDPAAHESERDPSGPNRMGTRK